MTTQTTDPITMALRSLAKVDERVAQVRAVVTRLVNDHGSNLPAPIAVRVEASTSRAHVGVQLSTKADTRLWAEALDVGLTESENPLDDLGHYEHLIAEFEVDGVEVRIASATWVPAARDEAVAA
ncbi:hypothetical protein [Streptomyces phaeochromogenes]|uniref:hypothetical protein n=1 Tax=Streptomyces phaeochromogenes TaxID=1923 RepID=UPI00386CDC9A|nr:hypothetical protein OG277_29000 [Streptomyces phaeochromogenes]